MRSRYAAQSSGLKLIFYLLSFVFFAVCIVIVTMGLSLNEQRAKQISDRVLTRSNKPQCYDLDKDGAIGSQDVYKLLRDWQGEPDADNLLGIMENWGTECQNQ